MIIKNFEIIISQNINHHEFLIMTLDLGFVALNKGGSM